MAQPTPWVPLSSARREIRLLDLAPKSCDPDQLSCDLRVDSLDNKPVYEALSYVWGEKADPPHILCVGGHSLAITKNLFEALRSLRWDDQVRTIWIDAVCIVQDNNEERSWQVSMMGDIYRASVMVLAWLGYGDLYQKLIRQVCLHALHENRHFDDIPYMFALDLGRESWWGRAWTLQEAVLAPSLTYCSGKERCTEHHIVDYYRCLLEHFTTEDACCRSLLENSMLKDSNIFSIVRTKFQMDQSRRRYRLGAADLLRLTLDHQDRDATDPRDKVFAFVGIANKKSVPPNLVQYGLPLLQSMVDTASKLLQNTNTLEVIRHATNPLPGEEDFSDHHQGLQRSRPVKPLARLQGLPSWCPDWTQDIPTEVLTNMRHYREEMHGRFRAGTSREANVVFHGSSRLEVTGIRCDRVIHIGEWDHWSLDDWRGEVMLTLRQWCHIVANSVAHHAALCDGCGRRIYGVWFRCQVCKNFQFCSRCWRKPLVPHAVEHKLSSNCFQHGKDWDEVIEEAKLRDTELGRVPGIKVETIGNGSFQLSGSSWEQLVEVDYPFTGDSLQDAFRHTLLGDHPPVPPEADGSAEKPLSDLEEIAAFTDTWCRLVEDQPSSMLVNQGGKYSQEVLNEALDRVTDKQKSSILGRLAYTLDRRRLVVSRKGFIGIAPAGTRIGDHICVLHGGEMPFILRQLGVNESPDRAGEVAEDYVLVGEAYVHGLMRGGAIRAADAGKFRRVQMVLH